MAIRDEREGDIAVITIDRPHVANALDADAFARLGAAFERAEGDASVRVVVLTGAGDKAFCAGLDLKAFGEAHQRATRRGDVPGYVRGSEIVKRRTYRKPVIAAVNGAAVAGGFELVLACDLVVAADHAWFALPEVKRGLIPGGGGTRLAQRIPLCAALELTLTGEPVPARRALELGLVNRVVPATELESEVMGLARRIASNAPRAIELVKRLVYEETTLHDADQWARIERAAEDVLGSNDAYEGARAFLEKRTPTWSGT